MPKFNVTVSWTETIDRSADVEVSAKDEGAAQEKIENRIQAVLDHPTKLMINAFEWGDPETDTTFEYEVSEA